MVSALSLIALMIDEFIARQGKWIGAKIGLFCVNPNQSGNKGWVDVDWFRIDRK
ncbi:MAG: Beta-xylosidase [Bacteroidetes bacterium]|nr:Beta-xylosidase [Bacteroidota bacterium]